MKTKLLLVGCIALFSFTSIAQNIQDKKINYSYIQFPAKPLKSGTEVYSVTVQQDFDQRNQDSLEWHEEQVKLAKERRELAMNAWNEQKKVVDRSYYAAMAEWEKQVAAGNTAAAKPGDPVYGQCPCEPDPPKPFLTNDIDADNVIGRIEIPGFTKGEGGATISLAFQGFDKGATTEKKSTSGDYVYTIKYKHPVKVKITDKGGAVVYDMIHPATSGFKSYTSQKFKSSYEFKLWWMDNESTFWEQRQKDVIGSIVSGINGMLSNDFGYPTKSKVAEIYTAKDKDHDYTDLLEAFQNVQDGLLQLASDRNKSAALNYFGNAVSQYQTILNESNTSDKKARVNKKVTSAVYCNIAECFLWMDDFSQAELFLNKAANLGIGKYKRHGNSLKPFIADQKKRFIANQ